MGNLADSCFGPRLLTYDRFMHLHERDTSLQKHSKVLLECPGLANPDLLSLTVICPLHRDALGPPCSVHSAGGCAMLVSGVPSSMRVELRRLTLKFDRRQANTSTSPPMTKPEPSFSVCSSTMPSTILGIWNLVEMPIHPWQPRFSCLQHHFFFTMGHRHIGFKGRALQSKGGGGVAICFGQPRCSCAQHHCILATTQDVFQFANPVVQS